MRIVVAEDSVLFREGLVRLLGDLGHDVVAAVADSTALLQAVRDQRPDLAVIDIRMPPDRESDGAHAAATIRRDIPEVGALLLSQHIELRHCLELIGTPGFGYLLKDRVLRLGQFDDSMRRVAAGGVALDPEVIRALVRTRAAHGAISTLTDREREVLEMVAQGQTNTAIADALGLSERTIETHMRAIFTKLGLLDDGNTHRRVRAVITYLETVGDPEP